MNGSDSDSLPENSTLETTTISLGTADLQAWILAGKELEKGGEDLTLGSSFLMSRVRRSYVLLDLHEDIGAAMYSTASLVKTFFVRRLSFDRLTNLCSHIFRLKNKHEQKPHVWKATYGMRPFPVSEPRPILSSCRAG